MRGAKGSSKLNRFQRNPPPHACSILLQPLRTLLGPSIKSLPSDMLDALFDQAAAGRAIVFWKLWAPQGLAAKKQPERSRTTKRIATRELLRGPRVVMEGSCRRGVLMSVCSSIRQKSQQNQRHVPIDIPWRYIYIITFAFQPYLRPTTPAGPAVSTLLDPLHTLSCWTRSRPINSSGTKRRLEKIFGQLPCTAWRLLRRTNTTEHHRSE